MIASQDFAPPDAICRADHPFFFHLFDDTGRPVVTDLEVALNKASRRLSFAADDGDGFIVEFVAGVPVIFCD